MGLAHSVGQAMTNARRAPQIATAIASATSGGSGGSANSIWAATDRCICSLVARPLPVIDFLTSVGGSSSTRAPARTATSSITPRAWAMVIAVLGWA